jgi:cytochrome c oxidase assembly protein subunit 15
VDGQQRSVRAGGRRAERLTVHLGLALFLFAVLLWTALDAWRGQLSPGEPLRLGPSGRASCWRWCSRSACWAWFVAGNDAGRIYTDLAADGGRLSSRVRRGRRLWATLVHDPAAVSAASSSAIGYLLFLGRLGRLPVAWLRPAPQGVRAGGILLPVAVTGQMVLGIVALMAAAPIDLGMIAQIYSWCGPHHTSRRLGCFRGI